ncbi:hypothetical protein FN976_08750 [Caenimonas sedimenti]|uniref:Uncharacterized protein n=1 Tax=Caenimonas sedimenti TaxID=2596921 RepID=A0A562ZTJ3_9BURK|nr:hypothetical protein [Caenimonas sedimenti]TWO71691.1 hypothetical protein FN976_08750 [Caenimonas sedimenti]
MGLIKRIFGNGKDKEPGEPHSTPASTQFRESENTDEDDSTASRNTQRRELVQVILRDTMRKHGIPSDWIDLRMLSTTSQTGRAGLHVSFVVKQGHDRLLAYVFAFQDSFDREMARFDTRASEWLLSVGWQFEGYVTPQKSAMPDPKVWISSAPAAIEPAQESPLSFAPTQDPMEAEARQLTPAKEADDLDQDLQALFAIRDAALAHPTDSVPPGFENTRPGTDDDAETPRR